VKVNRREVILMAVLLIISAGTAYFLYIWQPLVIRQHELSLELTALEAVVLRLSPWEGKEAGLQREIEELRGRIVAATEEKALGIPLPEYLVMVEAAAETANITIANTALHVTEIGGISQLDLDGSYPSVYHFLTILEEQDEALVLESLSFTGQNDLLRGQVQVRLFSGAIIGEPRVGGFPTRSPFAPRQ